MFCFIFFLFFLYEKTPKLVFCFVFIFCKFLPSFRKKKGAGKPGKSKVLTVPPGTIIYDDAKAFFKDLNQHGEKVLVAKGGQGGSHRTLNFNGIKGERRSLTFELKLLGDVSLVG